MAVAQAADGVPAARGALAAVAALVAVAALYVVATLASQGFWFDDLFTLAASVPSRPFMVMMRDFLLPETNPPLHYVLYWLWRHVVPDGEIALRLPGLAAYVLTILAAAFYPCRALARSERAVLAGLLATGFGPIYFASELRAYAVVTLASVVALLDAVSVAEAVQARERPPAGRLAALVLAGLVLSYEHYFGFLYAGSLIVAILAVAALRGTWSWPVFAAGAAIALGFGLWLALQIPAIAGRFGGGFWIELTPVAALRGFVRHTFTAAVPIALLGAAVAWVLWASRLAVLRDRRLGFAGIAGAINLAVPVAVSLHTPLLNARYFTPLRTVIYFALALLLAPLLRAWRGAALVLAALAALLVSYPFAVTPRASWREPSAFVREATQCDRRDILALSTLGGPGLHHFEGMFRYYLPDARFRFTVMALGDPVGPALATLNPTAPGCDVVAIGTNVDPGQPGLMDRLTAPFVAAGYEVLTWPSGSFVARARAPDGRPTVAPGG